MFFSRFFYLFQVPCLFYKLCISNLKFSLYFLFSRIDDATEDQKRKPMSGVDGMFQFLFSFFRIDDATEDQKRKPMSGDEELNKR